MQSKEIKGLVDRGDGTYTVATTDDIIEEQARVPILPEVRFLILDRCRSICEKCEQFYPYLDLHHIDGNPAHSYIENLTAVCPNCHRLLDRALRKK